MRIKPRQHLVATIASLLAIGILANTLTQRYILWTYEIGTQLVWRDAEALIFIGERNNGWQGGKVEWLFQVLKTAIPGGQVEAVDSRTDLVVLRYAHDRITRHVLKSVDISALQQMDGTLYAKVDDVIVKWTGAGFEPVAGDERERLFHGHLRLGDYDQPGGWSVRTNVLAWGKDGKCIPMTVGGQAIQLCQEGKMLEHWKRVTLGPAGTARVIWSLDSTGHYVDAQEYGVAVTP